MTSENREQGNQSGEKILTDEERARVEEFINLIVLQRNQPEKGKPGDQKSSEEKPEK